MSMFETACSFCTILKNGPVFAKSEYFAAIYNLAPVLPGHCLIIPKRHVDSVLELTPAEQAELVGFSVHVSKAIIKVFSASGFNWTIQEGKAAGQTVKHVHLHIIPRHEGDLPEPGDWYPKLRQMEDAPIDSDKRQQLTSVELESVTLRLRSIIPDYSQNKAIQ